MRYQKVAQLADFLIVQALRGEVDDDGLHDAPDLEHGLELAHYVLVIPCELNLNQVLLTALLLRLKIFQDILVELGLLGDFDGEDILNLLLASGRLRASHGYHVLDGLVELHIQLVEGEVHILDEDHQGLEGQRGHLAAVEVQLLQALIRAECLDDEDDAVVTHPLDIGETESLKLGHSHSGCLDYARGLHHGRLEKLCLGETLSHLHAQLTLHGLVPLGDAGIQDRGLFRGLLLKIFGRSLNSQELGEEVRLFITEIVHLREISLFYLLASEELNGGLDEEEGILAAKVQHELEEDLLLKVLDDVRLYNHVVPQLRLDVLLELL
jgi:hypothetical protein